MRLPDRDTLPPAGWSAPFPGVVPTWPVVDATRQNKSPKRPEAGGGHLYWRVASSGRRLRLLLWRVHPVLAAPASGQQQFEHVVHTDLAENSFVVVDHWS